MNWTTPVSIVVVAAVVATTIGALVRLLVGPLAGQYQIAAGVVTALLVVLVVGMVGLGARGEDDHWLENGGYW